MLRLETETPGKWIPITPFGPRRCEPLKPMEPLFVPEEEPIPASPVEQPEPEWDEEPDLIPA